MIRYFEYASVDDIKSIDSTWYDASPAPYSDSQILTKIRYTSAFINHLTGKNFTPVSDTFYWSGDKSRILCDPVNPVSILDVTSVSELNSRSFGGTVVEDEDAIDSSDYVIDGCTLVYMVGEWQHGVRNYKVVATLGEMDNVNKVSTTLSSDFVSEGSSVAVVDSTGIYADDVIIIDDDLPLIVGSVSGQTITVHPVPSSPLKRAGSSVVRYGRLKDAARQACMALVHRDLGPGGSGMIGTQLAGPIIKETTDNYSYTLASNYGNSNTTNGTGDPYIDMLLNGLLDGGYIGITEKGF